MRLISEERAELLNASVIKCVAPHLFLVCNFQPVPVSTISEDGRFLSDVQDLYRLAIDSGSVIRNIGDILYKKNASAKTSAIDTAIREVKEALKIIKLLRAMIDHNNSAENGYEQQEQIFEYENWMKRCIVKPVPETEEDYVKLNRALSGVAEQLINNLEKIISEISQLPPQTKQTVVSNWEEEIYSYYTRRIGNVYIGQLEQEYIARATAYNGRSFRFHNNKHSIIEAWIANMNRNAYLPAIENLDFILSQYPNAEKAKIQRRELLKKLDELEDEIYEKGGDMEYFFENLPGQLKQTMKENNITMLPKGLIQKDIERCFGTVSSVDFAGDRR